MKRGETEHHGKVAGELDAQHSANTPPQDPSNRRDGSSAAGEKRSSEAGGVGVLSKALQQQPKQAPAQDKSTRNQDRSTRNQDRSTRNQDRSTKMQDRSTKPASTLEASTRGAGNLDSSTRSNTRERMGTVLQRVMSVGTSLHPFDPRRSGPQERPKPNAQVFTATLLLLDCHFTYFTASSGLLVAGC